MPARDQSQEDMRLLVQSIRDYAIFMLDPGGVIVSWNIGAQRIKGYLAEEIIGTHFSAFYPPDDVASGKPAMGLRAAATEGRWEEEGWRVRKDGTRFWASVVITPLYDESGGLRGFGKVTRDLTFGLRPPADGLVESLAGYLEQTMTGVAFELVHDLDDEPPAETVVTVYRICQESLTNVRKHAAAANVVVELASLDLGVHVRVRDDGVGFTGRHQQAGHFGLTEMRERAEAAGGWWDIHGAPGAGTTVEFWVPAVPLA